MVSLPVTRLRLRNSFPVVFTTQTVLRGRPDLARPGVAAQSRTSLVTGGNLLEARFLTCRVESPRGSSVPSAPQPLRVGLGAWAPPALAGLQGLPAPSSAAAAAPRAEWGPVFLWARSQRLLRRACIHPLALPDTADVAPAAPGPCLASLLPQ